MKQIKFGVMLASLLFWTPAFATITDVATEPAGTTGEVQFNINGEMQADPDLHFSTTTKVLTSSHTATRTINFTEGLSNPPHEEGTVFYDDDQKTISFYTNESEVTVNVAQEMFVRATNKTGSTIADGQVVYCNGAQGSRPTVSLARSDAPITSQIIAMATHDVENNTTGLFTTFGEVHNLNTSSFAIGATLYVSSWIAGTVTSTAPIAPNFPIGIGKVTRVHATEGIILFNAGPTDVTGTMVIQDLDINVDLDVVGQITASSMTLTSITVSGLTLNSILFVDSRGLISEDNDKLFWHASEFGLAVGTNVIANSAFHLVPSNVLDFGLKITGSVNQVENLIQVNDSDGNDLFHVAFNGATRINLSSALAFRVEDDGTEDDVFIVDTLNRRVGIGMVPSRLLDMEKSSNSGSFGGFPGIRIANPNTTTRSFTSLEMSANNGSVGLQVLIDGKGNSGVIAEQGAFLGTSTNHPLWLGDNNTRRLKLDGDFHFMTDSLKFFFGLADDFSVSFTGDTGILKANEINSADKLDLQAGSFLFTTPENVDVKLSFVSANGNTGVLTWREDERHFDFSDVVKTSSGVIKNEERVTANKTLDTGDHNVFCDADGGTFTISLPVGVAGTEYRIINTSTGSVNVTIAPNGAELLLGANSNKTLAKGSVVVLVYNSTEGWR